MGLDGELNWETLSEAMPGRALRWYPALLSTEADALAWARAGAPHGALVASGYQVSARGRAGLEWRIDPLTDFAFSMILRPRLPPDREGWLYTVATSGLADYFSGGVTIEWPDEIHRDGYRLGAVGIHTELGAGGSQWAVVNVLVSGASGDRSRIIAGIIAAIESRGDSTQQEVLSDYLPRCGTLGKSVRARLIPLGPSGPQVKGVAVGSLMDGALLIEREDGRRVAVRPQNLGLLEHA